jgi:hypothetical protein
MNIVFVIEEILAIANSVIGESSLPDLSFATEDRSEGVRVSAFDELDRMFRVTSWAEVSKRWTCSGIRTKACNL